MSSNYVVDFRALNLNLGEHLILRDINLKIEKGECIALLGPSGAGKTSLLRVINGVIGDHLKSQSERAQIGFVHQDHSLIPNVRVFQNVLMGRLGRLSFWGGVRKSLLPSHLEKSEVYTILERVGIADKIFARTDTLSGGEKQRVALARALYQNPKMLLADEPTASLDKSRARQVMSLLCNMAVEEGWTLIVSLHDEVLAKEFFSRVIKIEDGALVSDVQGE